MAFQKAERRKAFLKLAVDGPSGGGKTYSSLRLARGLVGPNGKIAMIDTENGSGSLYATLTDYDVMEVSAPFTPQKYMQGIKEAVEGGYDVLVIDSLTHEWDGEGGLLDQKLALDKRGGNSFTNWATITKQHKEFVAQVLQSKIHIIATMRSKTEYEVQKDSQGKSTPTKLGLAPIQREGMEYEFTIVFNVAMDHTAAISKDRTDLFQGLCSTLTEEHGKKIREWLEGGGDPLPETPRSEEQAALPDTPTWEARCLAMMAHKFPAATDDKTRNQVFGIVLKRSIVSTAAWQENHFRSVLEKLEQLTPDQVNDIAAAVDPAGDPFSGE